MPESSEEMTQTVENRAERYARAAAMLRQWMKEAEFEDESDYDWEAVETEVGGAGLRCQKMTSW